MPNAVVKFLLTGTLLDHAGRPAVGAPLALKVVDSSDDRYDREENKAYLFPPRITTDALGRLCLAATKHGKPVPDGSGFGVPLLSGVKYRLWSDQQKPLFAAVEFSSLNGEDLDFADFNGDDGVDPPPPLTWQLQVTQLRAADTALSNRLAALEATGGVVGPPGPPGPPGTAPVKNFTFGIATTEWPLPHMLNQKNVDVRMLDQDGQRVVGHIVPVDLDNARVEWFYPMSGTATVTP